MYSEDRKQSPDYIRSEDKIINRIIRVVRELNTIESNLTVPLPVGPLFESHPFFSPFSEGKTFNISEPKLRLLKPSTQC